MPRLMTSYPRRDKVPIRIPERPNPDTANPTADIDGIDACRIRSIILPLLADHVLREANHYIRLLEA